jgi:hypothetical protein
MDASAADQLLRLAELRSYVLLDHTVFAPYGVYPTTMLLWI